MSRLLPLAVAVPLAFAAVATVVPGPGLRRILGFGGPAAVLAVGVGAAVAGWTGQIPVARIGGWPVEVGIQFAADLFSSLMLVVAALMVLACSAFAMARREDRHRFFHPLVLVLLAGVAGAFLTVDLFNLFVFFEVLLIASYVLLTLGGSRREVRAGAVYVATNLLASTVLVVGVALVYGAVGTVNMAALTFADRSLLRVPGVLLLVAFAVKGSAVPVHGWLPRAYPDTSPAVAALFSGLLTKVGIYAIFRVDAVVLGGDASLRTTLLVLASVTMVAGVLASVAGTRMRRILSFGIVGHVGFMVMGLGVFGLAGVAGGIFYILQHMVVTTSLFLSVGAVETVEGSGRLDRLGGVAGRHGVLAATFVVSALSLAGLPPSSGFFAKLALVRAAFAGADPGVAAVAITASFLTLVAMVRIWGSVFWGPRPPGGAERTPAVARSPRRVAALVAPAALLAAVSVAMGLGAEGMFAVTRRAAAPLVDPSLYVRAVMGS